MIVHLIQSGLLAILFFSGLVALLTIPLYPKVRNHLIQLPCQIRSKILTVWLLCPLFTGILLAFAGLMPSWVDNHDIATEHCASHTNGLAHLCWFDPIVHFSALTWEVGFGFLLLILLFHTYRGINLLIKHWHFQTTLRLIGKPDKQNGVFSIASDHFFVFSSGLFRPYAFISSQLIEQLSAKQLDVVLAHEQAHCQRRDVLRRLFLSLISLFHFSSMRKELLADLELAHEQICDTAAVHKVGDRIFVAETIINIARSTTRGFPEQDIGVIAFNGSHIDIRIQQLLEQPKPVNRYVAFFSSLFFAIIAIGILSLAMPLHHLI